MSTPEQRKQLSKFLSLVLRHQPEKIGLTLGEEGFVSLADLLAAMRRTRSWAQVTEADIREVVATSDKQRYEIVGENIRARYGHSVSEEIIYSAVEPPGILYHGTSPEALSAIRKEGLAPDAAAVRSSLYDVEQARAVGRRHHPQPVILTVRAQEAQQAGTAFFCPEPRLYLSTAIPPGVI